MITRAKLKAELGGAFTTKRKIADAVRAGHLSWCQPGRERLVSVADVERWLESHVHRARVAARPVGRPRNGARR